MIVVNPLIELFHIICTFTNFKIHLIFESSRTSEQFKSTEVFLLIALFSLLINQFTVSKANYLSILFLIEC